MKILKLTLTLFLTAGMLISCNDESSDILADTQRVINNDEIPSYSSETSRALANDYSRESILYTLDNQLKVPVVFTSSSNRTVAPVVKFRIATRKSDCKRGIGFRCGNDLPNLIEDVSIQDDERTFEAEVIYDYDNGYVIYQFNQINWNEL